MKYFQKIIYYSCFRIYKIILHLRHNEIKDIWYRNSFYFGYWKFLKSDIDITITFTNGNKSIMKKVAHTHSLVRTILPMIGELVFYSEYHKNALLKCVNSYELTRDPILVLKYKLNKVPDIFQKIIFLHKFLIANWKNNNIDLSRADKINFYSAHINIIGKKSFLDLIDELALLLQTDKNEFKNNYIYELKNTTVKHDHNLPNLIYSLFYNKYCYLHPHGILNELDKKIIENILLWELWGFFSQQAFTESHELEEHLNRMSDGLDALTTPFFSQEFSILAHELELINE